MTIDAKQHQSSAYRLRFAVLASAALLPGCGVFEGSSSQQNKPDQARTVRSGEPADSAGPRPAETLEDPVQRADSLAKQGKLDEARAEFERAIAVNPKLTVAYLGAGDIYRQQGDYKTAEQRYGRAAEIEPSNFDAQYKHGLTLQLLNRLGEAVRAYLRALTIRPDDFSANLNLATAYLQLNEPRQALAYAERAVQLDPASAPAKTNLGAIYAALDRHADAVAQYQQASELTPLSAPLLLNLADSLGKAGRLEEMVNTLSQLTATAPSANAYERLGSGEFRLRRYAEAEAAFRKALEIDPNHYPAMNGVAVCLLNKWVWSDEKDSAAKAEAVRLLQHSYKVEKNQPKVLDLLSRYGK